MNYNPLINENINLVYYIIHKQYPTYVGDEDLIQCGMLGLCKAANTWNQEKSQFSTYATRCIVNEIRMELRKRNKNPQTCSLDAEIVNSDGCTLGDMIMGSVDVDYCDLTWIYDRLRPKEREVFDLRLTGLKTDAIAERVGCHREMVRRYLRKAKRLLKELNEKGGL